MKQLRAYIICIISTVALTTAPLGGGLARAQSLTLGQNTMSNIAKSDPLIITGAIGTQNTFYHSSVGDGYRSPWANSLYANLNVSVYGIAMPFAFYYSNDNSSFNYPHFSFHIDPAYKNWRGHFGRSTMTMSSYVMNMSFNGIGLEYNSQKARFGAFYGELRNAINDDPADPSARQPQYRRLGWGFKAGYGSSRSYIDLFLLRACDQSSSVAPEWQQRIRPQDNVAIALRGGLGLAKWLSLRGNLAFTAFSTDKQAERIHSTELDRWDKVFSARYSSLMRMATDVSANLSLKNFNTSIFYRMVQPDYTTLGLYYTSNNFQSLGINASATLLKKMALVASFSGQEDNITRNQLYTTRGFVYNASASTQVGDCLQLSVGYNGYRQVQGDGTARVNDTTRVDRRMNSLYVTPSYVVDGDRLSHVVSLTGSWTENNDLNRFATGESDVTTLALGLSHSLEVKPWEMSFTTSLSHQQSDGYKTRYTSDVLSVGTGRAFLKDKSLSTSATLSLCYNNIRHQQRNLSLGAYLTAGYTLKKVHVFSLSSSFNKYSDTNITADRSSRGTTEVTASLGYTYTFSLLHLAKKVKSEKNEE